MVQYSRRRRFGQFDEEGASRSPLQKIALLCIIFFIAWKTSTVVWGMLESASGDRSAAKLIIDSVQTGVQVSISGEEWQQGETGINLYEGDKVRTAVNGKALIQLFDGTTVVLSPNTSISINEHTKRTDGISSMNMSLVSGIAWIHTTEQEQSIKRVIETPLFTALIKNDTMAVLKERAVITLKEPSDGIHITMKEDETKKFLLGEGQEWGVSKNEETEIFEGKKDIYAFRNPIAEESLKNPFITESIAMENQYIHDETHAVQTGTGSFVGEDNSNMQETPLVIIEPKNNAKNMTSTVLVEGTVNKNVKKITVNGENVRIEHQQKFKTEVKIKESEKKSVIRIEAMNAEGIILAKEERIIENAIPPKIFPPVTIVSPIQSGGTLVTSKRIIEITGETNSETEAILVNDYQLQLFKKGKRTWSYLANADLGNLASGKNIFTIIAVGPNGVRSAPRSIIIDLADGKEEANSGSGTIKEMIKQNAPLLPGSLTINSPSNGSSFITKDQELSILGTTSSDTANISVNGYTLSLFEAGNTTWKYIASVERQTMKRGKNIYRIVARNKKGEILDVLEYTLTFEP